jgi:hypothetical protein
MSCMTLGSHAAAIRLHPQAKLVILISLLVSLLTIGAVTANEPAANAPAPAAAVFASATMADPYAPATGLIVDCRGQHLFRSMSPKLVDSLGKELWGTLKVTPEVVLKEGIVNYCTTLEDAAKSDRAGKNPLVITAMGKTGPAAAFPCNPVLSKLDSERLIAENKAHDFLGKLKVCFVVD